MLCEVGVCVMAAGVWLVGIRESGGAHSGWRNGRERSDARQISFVLTSEHSLDTRVEHDLSMRQLISDDLFLCVADEYGTVLQGDSQGTYCLKTHTGERRQWSRPGRNLTPATKTSVSPVCSQFGGQRGRSRRSKDNKIYGFSTLVTAMCSAQNAWTTCSTMRRCWAEQRVGDLPRSSAALHEVQVETA